MVRGQEWWRGRVSGVGGVGRWDSVGYTIPAPAGTVQYVTGNFEV